MSLIPADPKISKVLIYGALFHCIYSTSIIAAYSTVQNPFLSNNDSKNNESKSNEIKKSINILKEELILSLNINYISDQLIFIELMKRYDNTQNKRK